MAFREERGIAYCGMACVLCRFDGYEDCRGCAADYNKKADAPIVIKCAEGKGVEGCFACQDYPCGNENDDCFVKQCARKKGVDGCFTCPEYPCGKSWGPLHNKRNNAFLSYARDFGKQALIDRLRINDEHGIKYQRPDCNGCFPAHNCAGDYDVFDTEDEVYQLLHRGRDI